MKSLRVNAEPTLSSSKTIDLIEKLNSVLGEDLMITDEGEGVSVASGGERIAAELETDETEIDESAASEEGTDGDDEKGDDEKPTEDEPADEKPGAGRTSAYSDEPVIVVPRAENPQMEDSDSHRREALLRSGATAAEYLRAAGPRARCTLRKALRRGHLRLDPPAV